MWNRLGRLAAVLGVCLVVATGPEAEAGASWSLQVAPGSSAVAKTVPAPATPQGVTSSCFLGLLLAVTINWSAVPGATQYVVLESTTSAAGPFTPLATVTGATTYTTGGLATGNYWFAVETQIPGSSWVSAPSAVTPEYTISALTLVCTSP